MPSASPTNPAVDRARKSKHRPLEPVALPEPKRDLSELGRELFEALLIRDPLGRNYLHAILP